jgi:hypothetical protein
LNQISEQVQLELEPECELLVWQSNEYELSIWFDELKIRRPIDVDIDGADDGIESSGCSLHLGAITAQYEVLCSEFLAVDLLVCLGRYGSDVIAECLPKLSRS